MSRDPAPHTFVAESQDLLRHMEGALLVLEQSPSDAEAVNAVFRAMHTIKGSAGLFGFDVIVEFTHAMEGVIDDIRAGRLPVDEVLVALLLTCGDHVSTLIACLETDDRQTQLEAARADGLDLLQQLSCYGAPQSEADGEVERLPGQLAADAGARPPGDESAVANASWHVSVRFSQDVLHHGMDPLSLLRYLGTLGRVEAVAAVFDAMPLAEAMDPRACYVGLEIRFSGDVNQQDIEDAFEFVRDDASVHILPPHAPLSGYAALLRARSQEAATLGSRLIDCGALIAGELQQIQRLSTDGPATQPQGGVALERGAAGPVPIATEPAVAPRAAEGRYVRVHAAKLDELITLVGELVIASAGVNLCAQRAADTDLREATMSMGRLVEQVRDGALSLRMVPIGETFTRFHRVVHDLSRELGKEVDLVISGAETELDKAMVEKLNDPLMHLVRNALDHGIEAPATRCATGKPPRGRLQLNAYHETGSVVIEVADDGAGIDREKVRARALATGLVQPDQNLSDRELCELILEPGFSTAETLTSVSGRGVGMDVARRNVEALRGSITIDSVAGQGALMALRVPLTLAIIDGFVVGVGAAAYVIPLEMVVECMELPADHRGLAGAGGYINLRGEVLPLVRLRDVFETAGRPTKRENIVVVQYAGQHAGFVVDALLGEFQTVIKPLGKLFERLAGISGSTILGTGEVALILDVPGLVQNVTVQNFAQQTREDRKSLVDGRNWVVSGPVPDVHGAGV